MRGIGLRETLDKANATDQNRAQFPLDRPRPDQVMTIRPIVLSATLSLCVSVIAKASAASEMSRARRSGAGPDRVVVDGLIGGPSAS